MTAPEDAPRREDAPALPPEAPEALPGPASPDALPLARSHDALPGLAADADDLPDDELPVGVLRQGRLAFRAALFTGVVTSLLVAWIVARGGSTRFPLLNADARYTLVVLLNLFVFLPFLAATALTRTAPSRHRAHRQGVWHAAFAFGALAVWLLMHRFSG